MQKFDPLVLHVEDLSCRRGGRLVLHGLSLTCASGTPLLLRGSNGVGKSTLLRVLAGLVPKLYGKIHIEGLLYEEGDISQNLHYIGHLDAVKPSLTVEENLALWQAYYGGTANDLSEALERFGLANLAPLPAQYLSAGQKKRLALARLLVCPRPIWLLDEPTTSLDSQYKEALESAIADYCKNGGLVIMTSHEVSHLTLFNEMRLEPVRAEVTV